MKGTFATTGTIKVEDGILVSHEVVRGAAGGIAEVEAKHRLLPDGRRHVTSRYRKSGQWVDGRESFYVEDPQGAVRFAE